MTNKEAIEVLQRVKVYGVDFGVNDAYNRAIKALEFIEENYPKTFEDYLNGEEI